MSTADTNPADGTTAAAAQPPPSADGAATEEAVSPDRILYASRDSSDSGIILVGASTVVGVFSFVGWEHRVIGMAHDTTLTKAWPQSQPQGVRPTRIHSLTHSGGERQPQHRRTAPLLLPA